MEFLIWIGIIVVGASAVFIVRSLEQINETLKQNKWNQKED